MVNEQSETQKLENMAIAGMASVTKTPFRTAFKITMGMGLAHLALFSLGIVIFLTITFLASIAYLKIFYN